MHHFLSMTNTKCILVSPVHLIILQMTTWETSESKRIAHLQRKHIAVFHFIGCRQEAALVIEGVELLHLNHYHYNVVWHNENCSADRGFCCWVCLVGLGGFCQFSFCIHMHILYTGKYGCTNFCGGRTWTIKDLRQNCFTVSYLWKARRTKTKGIIKNTLHCQIPHDAA